MILTQIVVMTVIVMFHLQLRIRSAVVEDADAIK